MIWLILALAIGAVAILVYAVLSVASEEDDLMEEFWEAERWKEQEKLGRKKS